MVVNPEPNLRPLTMNRYPHMISRLVMKLYIPGSDTATRNPAPNEKRLPLLYLREQQQGRIILDLLPESQCRPLFGQNNVPRWLHDDPQPKKKQKTASGSESTARPVSLPISEIPRTGFTSDDSDDDAASKAPSVHDNPTLDPGRMATIPSTTTTTTPPGTSTQMVLTPTSTIRILQPTDTSRPPSDPPFRPWSNSDDQELINLKNDTKSRPSWKTIGARLRRDPKVCKLRWGILKKTDQHGHVHPPHEPEAED